MSSQGGKEQVSKWVSSFERVVKWERERTTREPKKKEGKGQKK
jgi:hypothetical protein